MSCALSSSYNSAYFSSASANLYLGGTGISNLDPPRTWAVQHQYHRYGYSQKVLPTDEGVYSFAGQPFASEQPYTHYPASGGGDPYNATTYIGGMYMYLSSSTGIRTHLLAPADLSSSTAEPNSITRTLPDEYVPVEGLPITWPATGDDTEINGAFGFAVDAISSSNGIYIATSAPLWSEFGGTRKGKVFLLLSNSSGISTVATFTGSIGGSHAGGMGTGNWWNNDQGISTGYPHNPISLAQDDAGDVYIAFHDLRLSTTAQGTSTVSSGQGGIQLHKSSSSGVEYVAALTASTEYALEYLGLSNKMVADGNSLYIAAAAGRPAQVSSGSNAPGAGRVTLFEYDISAGTFTDTRIEPELNELNQLYRFDNGTADNERMGFRFGASVDMVSGSDGIYIAGGSPDSLHLSSSGAGYANGQGEIYIFRKNDEGISQLHHLTGTYYGQQENLLHSYYGFDTNIVSSSGGIIVVSTDGYANARTRIVQTGSDVSETRWISPLTDTYITASSYGRPPASIALSGNTLHLAIADWGATSGRNISDGESTGIYNYYANTSAGAIKHIEWGLSGSCSQQGENNNMVAKRGIAVYSGSANTVHKFLDDGTAIIGAYGSTANNQQMTGTLNVSSSNAYDIKADGKISGSYIYGDGSELTNISSENVDLVGKSDDVTYYVPFVDSVGTVNNATFYNDTDGGLKYNPNADKLTAGTLSGSAGMAAASVSTDGAVTGGSLTDGTATITAGAASGLTNIDASGDLTVGTITMTEFTVDASGNTDLNGTLNAEGATTLQSTLNVTGASTLAAVSATTLSATGDVDLGNATTDSITVTGRFDSDLIPLADSTSDLGTSTLQFAEAHIDTGHIDTVTATNVDGILGANSAAAATVTTLSATGDVDLGNAVTDSITVTGRFDSDLIPLADSTSDLGTSALQFAEAHIDTGHIDTVTATNVDGILGANTAAAATVTTLSATGNSTLGSLASTTASVGGRLQIGKFDGVTDVAQLNDMAASPSSYNGSMIYLSGTAPSSGDAAIYFANTEKWYFCESGSWYPSPFSSD